MKTNRPTFRSDEYADDSPDISAQKPFKGSEKITATTQNPARRAAARELRKLKDYGLVNTLERRIGGTRAGSGSLIWHLTEAGERFLAIGSSEQYTRRRYLEPSRMFLRHSLAV